MSVPEKTEMQKKVAKRGLALQVPSQKNVGSVKTESEAHEGGDDDLMIISGESEKPEKEEERDLSSLPAYYKLGRPLLKLERQLYTKKKTIGMYPLQMTDLGNPSLMKVIEKCQTFSTRFHAPKWNLSRKWDGFLEITFAEKDDALDAVEKLKSIRSSLQVVLFEKSSLKADMVREWKVKRGCKDDETDGLLLVDEMPEGTSDADMWKLFPDAVDIVMPMPSPRIHDYACIYYATPEKRDAAIGQSVNKTLHGQPLKVICYEASLVPLKDTDGKKGEPPPYPGFLTHCQLMTTKKLLKTFKAQLNTAEEAEDKEEIETLKPKIQELENKLEQRRKYVQPPPVNELKKAAKEAAKEAREEVEKKRQENLKKYERALKEDQLRRKMEADAKAAEAEAKVAATAATAAAKATATFAAVVAKVQSKKKQHQQKQPQPSGVPSLMSVLPDTWKPVKDNVPRGQQQRFSYRNDKGRAEGWAEGQAEGRDGQAERRAGRAEGWAEVRVGQVQGRAEGRTEGRAGQAERRAEGRVEGWAEGQASQAEHRAANRAEGRAGQAEHRVEGRPEGAGFGYGARRQPPNAAPRPVPHPEYGYAAGPQVDDANSPLRRYAREDLPPPPAPTPPAVVAPIVTDYGHGEGLRMGQVNPGVNPYVHREAAPYGDLSRSGPAASNKRSAAYDNAGGLGSHPNPTGKVAEAYSHLAGRRPVESAEPDMSQHPCSRRNPQNQQQRRHSKEKFEEFHDEQAPKPSGSNPMLVAARKLVGNIKEIDNKGLEGLLGQLSDELDPQQAIELLQKVVHEAMDCGDESPRGRADERDYNQPLRGEPARRPFQQGRDNRKRARFEGDPYM